MRKSVLFYGVTEGLKVCFLFLAGAKRVPLNYAISNLCAMYLEITQKK